MNNEFHQQLFFYSDEKLIEIVTTQRDEFEPEVVATAERLLRNRDYEIEFEGTEDEPTEVFVVNQEMEIVLPEDFEETRRNTESLRSMAWLFASIIFGFTGLFFGLLAPFVRSEEMLNCLLLLLPAILCLYFRNKVKNLADHP